MNEESRWVLVEYDGELSTVDIVGDENLLKELGITTDKDELLEIDDFVWFLITHLIRSGYLCYPIRGYEEYNEEIQDIALVHRYVCIGRKKLVIEDKFWEQTNILEVIIEETSKTPIDDAL